MTAADDLRARLGHVLDPELGAPITDLGMVGAIEVEGGRARVEVALTTAACPLRGQIERDVREAARAIEGVDEVDVVTTVMGDRARAELMRKARALAQSLAPQTSIPTPTPVIAVASGKGGVGKSSVAANLAAALALTGRVVGVLDADVWGFSLSRLLGVDGEVRARGGKMVPLERPVGDGALRLLSMGLLADEDRALLWRGLVVQKAVAQFIEDADWSGVEYFVIDTPPGTGDVAMTLARLLPQTGQLLVTTPSPAAQVVAARAGDFARQSNIRVLGVVENMSGLLCECGRRHSIFGEGGGSRLAQRLGVPLLASLALDPRVAAAGDAGDPVALSEAPDGPFRTLARRVVTDVAPPPGAAGCSARLLDALSAAVQPS